MGILSKAETGIAGLVIVGLLGAVSGGGFWWGRRTAPEDRVSRRPVEPGQVIVARPTRRIVETKYVEVPVPIKAPELTERDVQALAKKYGLELQTAPKTADEPVEKPFPVGENIIPALLWGGTALLTREPTGEVGMRIVGLPRPRFSRESEWELGIGVARLFEAGATWEPAGHLRWSPARAWRWRLTFEAGYKPEGYGAALATTAF